MAPIPSAKNARWKTAPSPANPDTLLEGGEAEPRLPIFKELNPHEAVESEPSVSDESASAAAVAAAAEAAEAEAAVRRKVREQEEAFAREQREAIARERE